MALHRMGVRDAKIVSHEEPTVICSLPYGIGRSHVPEGPEATVIDLSQSSRMPDSIVEDTVTGTVTEIDREAKKARIQTRQGEQMIHYNRLVMAPGSVPWIPPVPGVIDEGVADTPGPRFLYGKDYVSKDALRDNVFVLRNADDARQLDAFAGSHRSAAVIGSGAIGLEIAEALYDRGLDVSIVEAIPHVNLALDGDMAEILEKRLAERGIHVYTDAMVTEVNEQGVRLKGGDEVTAEGVVFATGVRPNIELAKQIGLDTDQGILVDRTMQTSVPDIYALGDVAQIEDAVTGEYIAPLIGTLAMRQGLITAMNIAGQSTELPAATVWGVSANFDIHWGSVGWTEEKADRIGIPVQSIEVDLKTRDAFMKECRDGKWKLVLAAADTDRVARGQILGFQVVADNDPPLYLVERFVDIVTRRESVWELIGHHFVHCPMHNAPYDPYLTLLFKAQAALG
ncbi:MAG: FAD-dependent oxidoreductase [Synergistales bacterium]|nr:FAD-dependent oxidoreductase [Synergistales bacterium]